VRGMWVEASVGIHDSHPNARNHQSGIRRSSSGCIPYLPCPASLALHRNMWARKLTCTGLNLRALTYIAAINGSRVPQMAVRTTVNVRWRTDFSPMVL